MKLSSVGEDALVSRLTAHLPVGKNVVIGVGDDCAVLENPNPEDGANRLQLFKTDCIVEGVHFEPGVAPEKIGWKSMARTVSDIGAMGGRPESALVTLVLPPGQTVEYAEGIYRGIRSCAERFGVSIVGGETSRTASKEAVFGTMISVSILGSVEAEKCILRSGGEDGDSIYVTGRLGGSISGWHLSFCPRIDEAHWLVSQFKIHSMMDLSDGLARDLPRLADASKLQFILEKNAIPCKQGCTTQQAIGDGEDYELLFTCSSTLDEELSVAWAKTFPDLKLTKIGKLTVSGQSDIEGGWDHFPRKPLGSSAYGLLLLEESFSDFDFQIGLIIRP